MDDAAKDSDVIWAGPEQPAIEPVQEVQGSVGPQGEDVVRGHALGLAGALDHEELGQNGHRLEPDTERPQHLPHGVVMGEDERQDARPNVQVASLERVELGVRGRTVHLLHHVQDVALRAQVAELEHQIIQRREGVYEQIEVATAINRHVD